MPSDYLTHKMGDLASTNCSTSFNCPLIRLIPQAAFNFTPSQKSCNGSFTRRLEFKQCTLARPREHSKTVSVHLLACGAVSGELQVDSEEEKAGNLVQPPERSLHVMATLDDDKEGSLAGLKASELCSFTAEMLQAGDMDKLLGIGHAHSDAIDTPSASSDLIQAQKERMRKKKNQQLAYLFAALASTVGITSLAGASVYCRFAWQMQGGEVPWTEMCGTFSLALGAAVGMEFWARWAHRVLWHASLWSMHESHHQHRDGPFELNDIFAIINAVPAIALMAFGFLNKGLIPGLCFGAGLGITVFGIAYMFVHDGLVHRRFPVGPIADVPYFQKVAAAHQLHHADKFNGVPYGLFLGPMELEQVGGRMELEQVLQKRKRENRNPING